MTEAQKIRKIKAIYRRWLEDEKFFDEITARPMPEFGDVTEVLRNIGSAIAAAQGIVTSEIAQETEVEEQAWAAERAEEQAWAVEHAAEKSGPDDGPIPFWED